MRAQFDEHGLQMTCVPYEPSAYDCVVIATDHHSIDYAQLVNPKGKAIGNPAQGAPALGFGWDSVRKLNQFNLIPGGHPPGASNEIVIDKGSADKGHFRVGEEAKVLTGLPPKNYKIVGIARFGSADNLAGASVVLFTLPEAQAYAASHGYAMTAAEVAASYASCNGFCDFEEQLYGETPLSYETGLGVRGGTGTTNYFVSGLTKYDGGMRQ